MKSQPPTSDRHRKFPDWLVALIAFQGLLILLGLTMQPQPQTCIMGDEVVPHNDCVWEAID